MPKAAFGVNFEQEKQTFEEYNINSAIAFPLFYQEELLGVLTIHYMDENDNIDENAIETLNMVADQISIAIHQAKLFNDIKIKAQRERLIGNILSRTIGAFDTSRIKEILAEIGGMTSADRCFFVKLDIEAKKGVPVEKDAEYRVSDDIKTIIGYSFPTEDVEIFINSWLIKRDLIVFDYEQIRRDNNPDLQGMINYSAQFDLKSGIGIPFFEGENLSAILAIEYFKEKVIPSDDELDFLRILGNQTGLVFNQIELYQKTKRVAETERSIRKIIEEMRSSLDVNHIKTVVVNEIGKAMSADICFILIYDQEEDSFTVDEFSEYKPDKDEIGRINFDTKADKVKWFMDAFRENEEHNFSDSEDYVRQFNLQGTTTEAFLKEYNIKSGYHIPIYYANITLGYIILNYTKDNKKLSENELSFLRTIATQVGIALHQARLYKKMQEQAEREKISRNIVEILRSTIDKKIIKHLFVMNIGKYFHADRVLFSDYDPINKKYLPVDKSSEYLSNPSIKSFVGFDWSKAEAREYIQPLLEKRELNIYCWDEYKKNNIKSPEFISLFEDAEVKSSYNLPVLYQERIMGYFCIEFTNNMCKKLPDEDINRIRNMCTQAGIALYHAELYERANELLRSKVQYMSNMSNSCAGPLGKIVELTEMQASSEIDKDKLVQIIKDINTMGKELLEKVVHCGESLND